METLEGGSGPADFCRTLFESMSDGCMHCRMVFEGEVPVDWIYLAVNPAFETAMDLKNVVGRRISELLPGIRESSPEVFAAYGRVAAGGGREFIEAYVQPLDAWFSIEAMPAGPGEFLAKFQDITASKRAEQAAAFSEAKFKALFELSPDPMVVHRLGDAALVMVNRAWCQLTGIPQTEALGHSAAALGLVLSLEEWAGFRTELCDRGVSAPRIVTIPTQSGAERQLLVTASKVPADGDDLVLGIGKDLTDRHRIEAELRESEVAFRTVFEQSPVALFLQQEGRFVHLNQAALSLFGAREASQLLGQSVFERTPAGERAGLSDRIQKLVDGAHAAQSVETRILTLDGTEVEVSVLGRLVTYRGLPSILVSVHDNRERKRSERALADAMSLLERTGELAKVGGYRLDVATMRPHWTPQIFRMLELEPGDTPSVEEGLAYYAPEARPVIKAAVLEAIQHGTPCDLELPAITAKGRSIWIRVQCFPVIKDGWTVEVFAAIQDITDKHKTDAALRLSERKFSLAFQASPDFITINRQLDGVFLDVNDAFVRTTGYSRDEVIGRSPLPGDLGVWVSGEERQRFLAALLEKGTVTGFETQFRAKDGSVWDASSSAALIEVEGEPCILAIIRDISARKRTEKALGDAKSLLERTGELAKVGGCLLDVETGQQVWTSQTFRILDLEPGVTPSLAQGLGYYTPAAQALVQAVIQTAIQNREAGELEVSAVTARGRAIRVRVQCFPVVREGRTVEVIGVIQDITERFEALEASRASERKFSQFFLACPDTVTIARQSDGVFLAANEAILRTTGYTRAEVLGRSSLPGDLGLWVDEADRARLRTTLLREGRVDNFEVLSRRKDGTVWTGVMAATLLEVEGEPCILTITRDMSAQKRAEEALRQQEAFTRTILEHLPVGVAVVSGSPAARTTYMNELFPRIYRTTREALQAMAADPDAFWAAVYEDPSAREALKARVVADIASDDPSRMHWERVPITREGEEIAYIDARNIPVPESELMVSTVWDVTDQVRREEENRRLEAQLHQVQKMESLGLLAGGVAHDVNNVLGAILALATIHRRKAPEGTLLQRDMEAISEACLRGGSLTRSLLGFSRKDLAEVQTLNLNDLVRAELRQLEKAVPPKVSIQVDLGGDLRRMNGDPAALSHAIQNLCANAFEAMPQGGRLTVRTSNSGSNAVILEVVDTGAGMAPEVLNQALVPFYSTKPPGTSGIGLGLAIVYGTVLAHQGTIDVHSAPGRGTRVRLRFPTSESTMSEDSGAHEVLVAGASAGKSILFVDDDPLILRSFSGLIDALGHKNIAVSSGGQAVALIEQGLRPDLVILDVNMPGLGGVETMLQLRKRVPALPVLLSTGLPSQSILDLVKQHPGVHLIAKPYSMEDLEAKIRLAAP